MPILVTVPLVRKRWPRTDETHVASQHAPKLGQFIDTELAQEAAHGRDTWVVLHLEDRPVHFVSVEQPTLHFISIRHHASKLVASEPSAAFSDNVPLVEQRTWRTELGDEGHESQQREEQDQRDGRAR